MAEERTISSTGGVKGVKPAQFQSIPPKALLELGEHYAKGAAKYGDDHNFRKGYEWSKSYSALLRHLMAFWDGEDYDAETGSKHIIAVAWHAMALATFMDEHPDFDDRYQRPDVKADLSFLAIGERSLPTIPITKMDAQSYYPWNGDERIDGRNL